MVQIEHFWDSLKLSWCRKLMKSREAWTKILQLNLLGNNHEMKDIWFGGPNLVEKISQKFTNMFWRETLNAMTKAMRKIPFVHSHWFFNLNIFDNDLFTIGGEPLKRYDFPYYACTTDDHFHVMTSHARMLRHISLR